MPVRVIGAGGRFSVRYANVKGKLVVTDLPSGIAFAKNGGKVLTDSQEFQDAARSSGLPAKPVVDGKGTLRSIFSHRERFYRAVRPRRRSAFTTRAALWPGAPMTPPPGCVPEPHRYSPLIGVA